MWNIIALLVCIFSINCVKSILNPNYPEYYVICPEKVTAQLAYYFDCRRFLNCTNGERVCQQCPPGTLFHPKKRQCDHPRNVKCLATPNRMLICGQISNGIYPHPNDCTKFIKCSNGVTYVHYCPPGNAFDSLRLLCDYKSKAKCCQTCEEIETSAKIDFQQDTNAETHYGEGIIDIRGGKKK